MSSFENRDHRLETGASVDPGQRNLNGVRPRPMMQAVAAALGELWPDGIPVGLRAKERDWRVRHLLEERGVRVLTDGAVRRAIERVLSANRDSR